MGAMPGKEVNAAFDKALENGATDPAPYARSLALVREAVKLPLLDFHRDWDLGPDLVMPETDFAKRIAKVDPEIRDLVRKMLQTMYSADGIGLAAPQVGIHKQLIVIDCEPDNAANAPLVLVNPTIKKSLYNYGDRLRNRFQL